MAKSSLLPRGFKAEAERTALKLRKELNLLAHDPLCGFELAKHLNISVYTPIQIFPSGISIDELVGTSEKDSGWSALTMKTIHKNSIIIHNHLHAPPRQQSNLMHELAHIICEHQQTDLKNHINLPFFMRSFNKQQEEEAVYLGSVLQIPREALIWALRKRMEIEEISEHFNASLAMVTLRINSTGVRKQLGYLSK